MIVFEGVAKVYEPNVIALNDATFVIEKGEFVFIVGPSGSGKSTIVRLLLKEIEPTAGKIIVGGSFTNFDGTNRPLPRATATASGEFHVADLQCRLFFPLQLRGCQRGPRVCGRPPGNQDAHNP